MLGFDFALTREIDRDQYDQFERLVGPDGLEVIDDGQNRHYRIEPTDRVILVYPEPYWTRPIGDGARPNWPKRYQRLERLLRDKIALRLAGDLHHYMRWTSPPTAAPDASLRSAPRDGLLVTCGTGGAFTHPTHTKTTTRPIRLREHNADHEIAPHMGGQALVVGLDDGRAQPRRRDLRADGSVGLSRCRAEPACAPGATSPRCSRPTARGAAAIGGSRCSWACCTGSTRT